MAETMRTVRFSEYGPPDVLAVETAERPTPGDGKVVVRVRATGVHPFDTKVRRGLYKEFVPVTFPHTPGIDVAGTIEAVGPGVTEFTVGDAVFGSARGAYAEYAVADPAALALKPDSLTFEQASTLVVGAGTAWTAVVKTADVQPGQRVLVTGGAGGVGMFAVQLARWKGAGVIATTSTKNLDFVRSLGAEPVDYTTTKLGDVVRDVDVAIDTVGGESLADALGAVKNGGVLVTIAGEPDTSAAESRGVRTARIQNQAKGDQFRLFAELTQSGDLVTEVSKTFSLTDAAAAQAASETGHGRGRIVLVVDGE